MPECPHVVKPADPTQFWQHGQLNFRARDVGWIVSGVLALIACTASFWLIIKHLRYYTCPQQQRHIVRMLFMVPVYALVSFLSYYFYPQAIVFQLVRDCYEAVVITSFVWLLLQYVGDTPAEQNEVFSQVQLKKWVWPLGWWRYRPTGLHFLWIMKICILQYAIVRPVCTIAAVGLQYMGLYCLASWSPAFGHLWIALAITISVTVALYALLQLYMPIQKELKPYSPILKFLAVKAAIFIIFWQSLFLSILFYFNVLKETEYFSAEDVQVGIEALLLTAEMCVFAFLHIKAFTYLVYRPADRQRTTKMGAAMLDVMDFRDWWRGMRDSSRYIVARSRGRDFTEVDDIRRQKYVHLHKALGRERHAELLRERQAMKQQARSFFKDGGAREEIDVEHAADAEKSVSGRGAPSSTGKTQSSASAGLLRPARTVCEPFEDDTLSPQSRRAMAKGYEDEDDDDEEGGDAVLGESRGLIRALTYNRGQQPDKQSIRFEDDIDRHPELSRYHNPALQSPETDEKGFAEVANDELVLNGSWVRVDDAAEQQRHAPRQGSGSLGAWWRSVRERISGSGADDDEHDAYGVGYSAPSGALPHDDDDGALPSAARIAALGEKKKQTSSSSAESVLRSSPLDNIISTCRTSSHDSDAASPSGATAEAARPPLLHSVSAGQGVLGAAFSRVSSMRTSEPPSEQQHTEEAIVSRGAVPHELGVPTPAAAVVKSEQGHISAANSAVRDDGLDAAAPRAPSPTASSAVGPLPKGMLFSDPLSPRYAERAAARPAPPVSVPRPAKRTKTASTPQGAPLKPARAPTAQDGGASAPRPRDSAADARKDNKRPQAAKTSHLEGAPSSSRVQDTPSGRHLENTPSSREADAWRQRQETERQQAAQEQQQQRAKADSERRPELPVLVPADFSSLRSPPPGFAAESSPQLHAPKAQRASLFSVPAAEQGPSQPAAPPVTKQAAAHAPRASLPPAPRQSAPTMEQAVRQEPQRSVSQPSVAPVATVRSQPPPLPRTASVISAKAPEATATASGPKGRKIKLSLPGPLSPETFPYGAEDQMAAPGPTSAPAAGGSAFRQSRIAFADDPRVQAAAPASRVAASTTGSGRAKTAEEREREYLGLPAPPGSKGRVVNGARSQAQEDAAREAAARAREDAERVKRFEAWRAEKEQHERAAREKEAKARAAAEAERVRRSSMPAPGPSQIAAILPPVEMKWTWLGKKPKQPAPYTPLPAPSQLGADVGDERDAFTAGAAAREDMEQSALAPPSHIRAGVGAGRRASAPLHPGVGLGAQQQSAFAVGSVAPRGAVMDPTRHQLPVVKPYPDAPGMPRPRTSAPAQAYPSMPHARHSDQPRQAGERYWASHGYSSAGRQQGMPYPQHTLQPTDFAPAPPSNAVGSYVQRPAPRARASYDPYTGEPASFRGSRPDVRAPRHSYQHPSAGQRPDAYTSLPSRSRVVSDPRAAHAAPHREQQRPRQELRDGFHFESY